MEQQLFLAATELFFDMSPLNAEAVKPHPKCHPAAETVAWKLNNHDKTVGDREGEWGLHRLS